MTDFRRIYNIKLYIEAFIVGISTIPILFLLDKFEIKNKFILVFALGAILHIVYEILGLNNYYCKNFNIK